MIGSLTTGGMMNLSRYSAWLGIGLGILGLGVGLAVSVSARAHEPIGAIGLEGSLPSSQADILRYDREFLTKLQIQDKTFSLKQILPKSPLPAQLRDQQLSLTWMMGLPGTSARDLESWLEARVQAIVGSKFVEEDHLVTLEKNYAYPYPGVFPIEETYEPPKDPKHPNSNENEAPAAWVVIMSNVGEYGYRIGKGQGALLGFRIDGIGTIPIHSPRSGIIRAGETYFEGDVNHAAMTPANAISRLKYLFHEARHSDGHGTTLAFHHAICPPGHELHGRSACDRNLNGPYMIEGAIAQAMTESCRSCSRGDREQLKMQYADAYGRLLPYNLDQRTVVTAWDPTPEGVR